jgi:hypothetical protein
VLDASLTAPVAVALLTVLATRRAGSAWWSAWVAGVVTWIALAAVTLRVAVSGDAVSAASLSGTVEGLPWAVSTVTVIGAFAVAVGGPASSPVAAVGVTAAGLVAAYLEPSAAVVLPGLLLAVVATAGERHRGAVAAAVVSTGVVLIGAWVVLMATGRSVWPGSPAVDPGSQGPVALLAIPGLLTVVTSILAVQLAEKPARPSPPVASYRSRRTIP